MALLRRLGTTILAILEVSTFSLSTAAHAVTHSDFFRNPSLRGVTAINADGYFDVLLKKGNAFAVRVASDPLLPVHLQVEKNIIYIKAPRVFPVGMTFSHKPLVYVDIPDLKKLTVFGPVQIIGKAVFSSGLYIYSYGSETLQLSGRIRLDKIEQSGRNAIYMTGIHSDLVSIDAKGDGSMFLEGEAQVIAAHLDDNAVLQGEKLRANAIQIQAKGRATATVFPVQALNAFALEKGTVYYHRFWEAGRYFPQKLTRYTVQQGNVFPVPEAVQLKSTAQ